jgi:hypothetical protein
MAKEALLPVIGGAACVAGAVLWVFRPTLGSVIGTIAVLALLSAPASGLFGPRRPDTSAIDRQCDLDQRLYELARLQALLRGSPQSESADRDWRNELDRKRRELHKEAESRAAEKRRTNTLLCGLFLSLALLGFFRFRGLPQKATEEVNPSGDLSTPQQRWEVTTGDIAAILAVMAWVEQSLSEAHG